MPDTTPSTPIARYVATEHAPATLIVRACECTGFTAGPPDSFDVAGWTVSRATASHERHDDGTDVTVRDPAELLIRIQPPDGSAAAVLVRSLDIFHLTLAVKRLRGGPDSITTRQRWLTQSRRLLTNPTRWARPRSTAVPADAELVDAHDLPSWLLTGFTSRAATAPYRDAGFEEGARVRDWLDVLPREEVLTWARVLTDPMQALLFKGVGFGPDDAAALGPRWAHLAASQDLLSTAVAAGWTGTHLRGALGWMARTGGPTFIQGAVRDLIRSADGVDPDLLVMALRAGLTAEEAVDGLRRGTLEAGTLGVLAGLSG